MGDTIEGAQNVPAKDVFMKVGDLAALGNLIKHWSTGDIKYTGGKVIPRPTDENDVDGLRKALETMVVGATIPDSIKRVRLIDYGEDEMVLRIPPRTLIESTEAKLAQENQPYTIPTFYLASPIAGSQAVDPVEAKLTLHAKRIGDYTIAHCE
ncbi:hypothetical protein [Roseomonas sp. AR75]|uniref:hypothetical protein n=1 Tax=Roseomonas sp. AR75 TaxID=2562311 RepID=UPI0010BFD100|nr:hypothetical protein [Roseomonas sp. AR75]